MNPNRQAANQVPFNSSTSTSQASIVPPPFTDSDAPELAATPADSGAPLGEVPVLNESSATTEEKKFDPNRFTLFDNAVTAVPNRNVSVEEVVELIRTDATIKDRTEVSRQILAEQGKEAYNNYKKRFVAVTFSGVFTYRENEKWACATGFVVADVDGLGDDQDRVRKLLEEDPHVVLVFRSPSGTGLKAVVKTSLAEPVVALYRRAWRVVADYLHALTGCKLDKGNDPARLCFLAHDPDAYYKPNATPLEIPPEPVKPPKPPKPPLKAQSSGVQPVQVGALPAVTPAGKDYAERALDLAVEAVRNAPEGGRNTELDRQARGIGNLVGAGALDYAAADAALHQAAVDNGVAADEPEKTADTLARGLKAGMEKPRDLSGIGDRTDESVDAANTDHLAYERPLLRFTGCNNWLTTPPPEIQWVLRAVLAVATVGIVTGAGGCGKSFLMLALGMAIATGTNYGGFMIPSARRVLVLNGEDGGVKLHHRVRDVAAALGLTDAPLLRENFQIESLAGDAPYLIRETKRGVFEKTLDFKWLDDSLAAMPQVGLLVLDTRSRFFLIDENDNSGAAFLVKGLEELALKHGCSILLVCHEAKAAAKESSAEATPRGAGALRDCARVHVACRRMTDEQASKFGVTSRDYMTARVTKANDGEEDTDDRYFRRVQGGALVPAELRCLRYREIAERLCELIGALERPMTRSAVEKGAQGYEIRNSLGRDFKGFRLKNLPDVIDVGLCEGLLRVVAGVSGKHRSKASFLVVDDGQGGLL